MQRQYFEFVYRCHRSKYWSDGIASYAGITSVDASCRLNGKLSGKRVGGFSLKHTHCRLIVRIKINSQSRSEVEDKNIYEFCASRKTEQPAKCGRGIQQVCSNYQRRHKR